MIPCLSFKLKGLAMALFSDNEDSFVVKEAELPDGAVGNVSTNFHLVAQNPHDIRFSQEVV